MHLVRPLGGRIAEPIVAEAKGGELFQGFFRDTSMKQKQPLLMITIFQGFFSLSPY